MLALHLLDILVKNCGYPFHLQIATKEFLNELVRRFPERPPPRPSRIQLKILEMIHQWHSTICETSRYKDDLGFIRDMHRLLSYKGYKFPEVQEDSAAVLNPSDSLKSAEELEEEDRSANAAKLQELIRRGTTHDLQEANRLMKLMAGYDQSRKTDYRAKAAQDLEKVRRKATLLGEMLAGVKAGDKVGNGDIYEEMAAQIRTAQPKIQKMCQEESDDQEAVNKMLALNDLINTLDEQYHALRDGDYARAEEIKARVPKDITSAPRDIGGSQSLIDMEFGLGGASEGAPESTGSPDTSAGAPAGAPTAQASENHSDDLLGLSFTDDASQNNPFGMGGSISLGGGAAANSNALGNLTSSSGTVSPQPAQQASQPRGPNYSALEGLSNLSLGSSTSPRATSPSAPAGTNAFDNLGSLFGSSSGTTPQSRSPAPPMAAPATSSGAMQMGDFMSGFGSAPSGKYWPSSALVLTKRQPQKLRFSSRHGSWPRSMLCAPKAPDICWWPSFRMPAHRMLYPTSGFRWRSRER